MDNQESHMTIEEITEVKENGVVTSTLPAYTNIQSHKLQPLESSVFITLKMLQLSIQQLDAA
jgi:hypothetical protein